MGTSTDPLASEAILTIDQSQSLINHEKLIQENERLKQEVENAQSLAKEQKITHDLEIEKIKSDAKDKVVILHKSIDQEDNSTKDTVPVFDFENFVDLGQGTDLDDEMVGRGR